MSFKRVVAGLLASSLAFVGAGVWAGSAIAQTDIEPFDSAGTDDDGTNLFGSDSDPYDLIHRAILTPSMSAEEFFEQQNRALGTEAQNFRLRQQEALRQQPALTVEDSSEAITVDGEEL